MGSEGDLKPGAMTDVLESCEDFKAERKEMANI